MVAAFWFLGEVGGALLASVVLGIVYGEEFEQYAFVAYIAAIVGAAVSAWIAFQIVRSLPEPEHEFDDEHEYDADQKRWED